jgi:hypothetical protein
MIRAYALSSRGRNSITTLNGTLLKIQNFLNEEDSSVQAAGQAGKITHVTHIVLCRICQVGEAE